MFGIINSSILEYYYNLPKLLACSISYTKHLHIFRTDNENIAWKKNDKIKYGINLRKTLLKFMILGSTWLVITTMEWNCLMWLTSCVSSTGWSIECSRKMWCPIFLWGIGVGETNSCVLYQKTWESSRHNKRRSISEKKP